VSVDSPMKWAARTTGNLRLSRPKRFDIVPAFFIVLLGVLGVCEGAHARLAGFGSTEVETTTQVFTPQPDLTFPQATMPGSILTPILRLDMVHVNEASGDVDIDTITELISLTVQFEKTRAKDVAAIAIAEEWARGLDAAGGGGASPDGLSPNNSDALGKRQGDWNIPIGTSPNYSIFSPDEDPIIAYVPMAQLLNDPVHPLDPYDTFFSVTFNLYPMQGVTPVYATRGDYFSSFSSAPGDFYSLADLGGENKNPPVFPLAFGTRPLRGDTTTFYVLVEPSKSLPNKAEIGVTLPAFGDLKAGFSPGKGFEFQTFDDAYLFYLYFGLIIRTPRPVVEEVELPAEEGEDPVVVYRIPDQYFEDVGIPRGPVSERRPRFIGVDMAADQVPLRKLQNVDIGMDGGREISVPNSSVRGGHQFRDNRAWSEFPSEAIPRFNEIWSQWPPGYPILSLQARDPDNASDYIVAPGRFHPDSGIVSGPIPSPEVLTSGDQKSLFAYDLGGGWPGGYSPRIDKMTIEIQGLGTVQEIPADGKDNDGDGLIDEQGAEDTTDDLQLAGRNDDFDFFTEIFDRSFDSGEVRGLGSRLAFDTGRNPLTTEETLGFIAAGTPVVSLAVDRSPLSATEIVLAANINQLYELGRQRGEAIPVSSDNFVPGQQQRTDVRIKRGLMRGVYNKSWDPIFEVVHVMDEQRRETTFDRSPKYYRDVVTPGYDPERGGKGLTDAYQPELRIQLDRLQPERREYIISLLRIGAIQSRMLDEDGDGEMNSPVQFGFKIADLIDNVTDTNDPNSTGNGLVDESIDEESENHFDDDLDGLVDEDVNFVPVYMAIDEEIHNFFVDGFGGTFGVPDKGIDFIYIDYNNNGIYEDGRDDLIAANRDELVSRPAGQSNPLRHGASYYSGLVFPIDDDLDAEGEDGNPLTPPLALYDGIDNDGDGLTDEGWNEDCRDVVFGTVARGRSTSGYITEGFLFKDTVRNTRFDPGETGTGTGDRPVTPFRPGTDVFLPPITVSLLEDDPDRYLITYDFGDPDITGGVFPGIPGPETPNYFDGKYDFFLGFRVPANMPPGLDFQATMIGDAMRFAFDFRTDDVPNLGGPEYPEYPDAVKFSLPEFNYWIDPVPGPHFPELRYPATAQLRAATALLTQPARSTAYQVTKRQCAHVEISDMMGFTSPLEKDGGFRGRPFLEAGSAPTAILGINLADSTVAISERNTKLTSVRVTFVNVDSQGDGFFDPTMDLKPLSNSLFLDSITGARFSDSGVALYVDSKTAGIPGEFDAADTPVELALDAIEWEKIPSRGNAYAVDLKPLGEALPIPNSDYDEIPGAPLSQFDPNRGYDFFIAVRTSDQIDARDSFRAFIGPGDVKLTNGANITGSFCMTHPYAANVPVFLERLGSTGSVSAGAQVGVLPGGNSTPVLGINLHDSNNTFDGTPARLSTVSVILEAAEVTSATFYPRIGDLPGTPGDLETQPGSCSTSGESICATGATTFTHTVTLDGVLSSNFYTVHLWLKRAGTYTMTLVRQRGGARTVLASFTEVLPFLPTNTTPTLFEDSAAGPFIGTVPGDQIALEVNVVPETASREACYYIDNCSENPPGSGNEPVGFSWVSVETRTATGAKTDTVTAKKPGAPEGVKEPWVEPEAESGGVLKQIGGFTISSLASLTNKIVTNIPLDPAEDNDGDPRTFAIPDGLDNDGDGLTDEGLGDSFNFSPDRYTTLSGVALFRDMPNSDRNGKFDDPLDPKVIKPDLPVFLSGEEEFSFPMGSSAYVALALDHDPTAPVGGLSPGKGDPVDPDPFETIPTNDELLNAGNDYFVVIRTSRFLRRGTTFQARLGVLTGSVNPEYPGDNLAVFAVPFGFMPGSTTGLGPNFPYRQPYLFDPLQNFRSVPSKNSVAEEPLSPGSVSVPGENPELLQIETPFTQYESYKSLTSAGIVATEDGNSPPSLRWLEPTFSQTRLVSESLVTASVLLKWNDLDQDDQGTTVTLVYYPVLTDPIMGEIIPRTPVSRRPDGEPFGFKVISGLFARLGPGDDLADFTTQPYENIPLANDNEDVTPATGLGNDVFTWDARLVAPGLYRVAAILDDGDNPRLLVVGGRVQIVNERPVVTLTHPVGENDGL